uniref:NADH-ubiquinone oxidoreductase chain 2 n=1 Tax=Daphnia pulex TaxID=6669 RepID=Q2F2N8_DAPPU|nr:NADH dehydrogenase subunit 2 [Daphnia pulex]
MWLSPSLLLMIISIVTSICLVISSPSLFISWIGLELNTLAFLPLLLSKKSKLASEASIKYFLTQTLASVFILVGGLWFLASSGGLATLTLLLGLSIKLGAAPFHSWVLSIAEASGWVPLFALLTIQKINPLLMLWMFCYLSMPFFYVVVLSSLIMGGLAGLTQTSVRSILTFSSINHVGWLMTALSFSLSVGAYYFLIYLTTLLCSILIFHMFNVSHVNQLPLLSFKPSNQMLLFFALLSLGGLPPFLGFLPKWMILQLTVSYSLLLVGGVMISMSLVVLFFYLRLMFSAFMMGGVNLTTLSSDPLPFPVYFVALFSITGGGLSMIYFL